jgi:hypothetical protein
MIASEVKMSWLNKSLLHSCQVLTCLSKINNRLLKRKEMISGSNSLIKLRERRCTLMLFPLLLGG